MKERYELPDDQCERLTRSEMQSLTMLMANLTDLLAARDDLKGRLECVPSGAARMNMLIGQMRSLLQDIFGTVTDKQRRHLRNICKDQEIRLVPKTMPNRTSVIYTKEEAKELIDAAMVKCIDCFKDDEESRDCVLRKNLEVWVPLDSYSAICCPYSKSEWEDE